MVHPDDRERYLATGRGRWRAACPSIEYRIATADGTLVWFGVRGVPMFDPAARFNRMVGARRTSRARKPPRDAVRFLAYHVRSLGLPNRACSMTASSRQCTSGSAATARWRDAHRLDNFSKGTISSGTARATPCSRRSRSASRLACAGRIRWRGTAATSSGGDLRVNAETDRQISADKILRRGWRRVPRRRPDAYPGASIGIRSTRRCPATAMRCCATPNAAMYRAKQLGRQTSTLLRPMSASTPSLAGLARFLMPSSRGALPRRRPLSSSRRLRARARPGREARGRQRFRQRRPRLLDQALAAMIVVAAALAPPTWFRFYL